MNPLQSSVYELIKVFVDRQSIVLEALRDLRPDFIIRAEGKVNQFIRSEWQDLVRKYSSQWPLGFWGENDEWAYRVHGFGCHLTHTITGEIIGWDMGSLKRFDWHWFADYVDWLLETDKVNENVDVIRKEFNPTISKGADYRFQLYKFIEPILVDLEEIGKLDKSGLSCILI